MGGAHECHPVVATGILDQKISRYGDKITLFEMGLLACHGALIETASMTEDVK